MLDTLLVQDHLLTLIQFLLLLQFSVLNLLHSIWVWRKRIIQLLQDDLNGIKNQQPERGPTAPLGSDVTNSWKTTATRTKKSGNPRYFPNNIPNNQKPIPVIQTSNRFNVLHNLQAAQIETSTLKRTPEIQRSKDQTLKQKAVNRVTRVKPSKKITLIGDSHTRGLATELRNLMGREYFISSTFMPGAGLESITKLAKSEMAALTRSDTIIVCGGSNDASKNKS